MRVVLEITERSCDRHVLRYLTYLRKRYLNIRELAYLQDFANLETIENMINPKDIIRDMLVIYLRNAFDIYRQPYLLNEFVFIYYDESRNEYSYKFSNNMMFSDDITILCFLYNMIKFRLIYYGQIVQILISLMKSKYGIIEMLKIEDDSSENKIALLNVALSFPSVSWDMANYLKICTNVCAILPEFDFPKIICIPAIVTILPRSMQSPPFAMLMITRLYNIEAELKEENYENVEKSSLSELYDAMYELYECQMFPERLKIELCEKWQIVVKEGNTYKYAPYFAEYRQKAKDMITNIRLDDPDLEYILSLI
ncbi:uncharacterized protein LOC112552373 [Pogonomyrmex barbatus]|uniref:Uncharacterized protein LOC112552373 n=1 Tax=Pogonomyrmex barbatus TaxID=144034 RepID=A0A8N1S3A6_9HYME|nr:uncharacterized protein LOC112552373 [Pogonomyrmex barbatus]